jgi:hypothetical protein
MHGKKYKCRDKTIGLAEEKYTARKKYVVRKNREE